MAAGGFKEFVAGETLDEDEINDFLMQGVLVFAGTAARGSAITSPVEGQFAFLKDDDALTFHDGSDWVVFSTGTSAEGSGGTEVTSGGYKYHTFTGNGTFTCTKAGLLEVVMIAGGGGGGVTAGIQGSGGGGGAGGVLRQSVAVTPQAYSIVVGAGGASASQGVNSTGFSLTATGGGFGSTGGNDGNPGGSGGSGGGGSGGSGNNIDPGTGTTGQGNIGGYGRNSSTGANRDAAGGGGAGGQGFNIAVLNVLNSGDGGIGIHLGEWATATSTGDSSYYGGGGGGGETGGGTPGSGGFGGGGAGGSDAGTGTNGTINTGGGGGGDGATGAGGTGGSGGSGLVMIRYAV